MRVNIGNKNIILVDYFDTVVFRHVDYCDVQIQWANLLKQKFTKLKDLSADEIINIRNSIKYENRNKYDEVPYSEIIHNLRIMLGIDWPDSKFYDFNLEIEKRIEMSVQYVNKDIAKWLKKQKQKGVKIYIVSDFYLPLSAYKCFLQHLKIDDIFDGIYVSEEVNATKRRGNANLFRYVLNDLGASSRDVLMIGDNLDSVVKMANKIGIEAVWYKKRKKHLDCSKKDFYKMFLILKQKKWKNMLYMEYSYFLYVFIKKLYNTASNDCVKILSFLSRDGYFLKKLFDKYQELFVPDNNQIGSVYCYNSRFLNSEALHDDDIKNNFVSYMSSFVDDGSINIVDCGWNNSAQENIHDIMNINTRGYYIGTFSKRELGYACKRLGLIYDIDVSGTVSDYYWLLRTNFTLIEQMLGAPHGSVVNIKNGIISFDWPAQEKYVYNNFIKQQQQILMDEFIGLSVWFETRNAIDLSLLAKMNVKSGLFANKNRLQFVNELSSNYFDNFSFGDNRKGNVRFRTKKLSLLDRLFFPEKKLSVLVKRQRHIKTKVGMLFYKMWACLFYFKLVLFGKFERKPLKK